MLRANAEQRKFKSKRAIELEKLKKQKVHSRTTVRIHLPDGFVLQGRFGALEKISEVYDFVFENIYDKKREFYLYLSPPKQVLNKMEQTFHSLNLCPTGKIMFSWKDEE